MPDRFKALHFTRLHGGVVTPEFAQRLADFTRARQAMNAEPTGRGLDADRRAPSLARPRFVLRGNARASSTAATRRSPSWHAACSASCSRCCSASPASARPRSCARASCRGCARTATARSTSASPTPPMRPSPASRSSRPSCRPRATPGQWTQAGVASRRRVAVGIPAPPRRRAAGRGRQARSSRC